MDNFKNFKNNRLLYNKAKQQIPTLDKLELENVLLQKSLK